MTSISPSNSGGYQDADADTNAATDAEAKHAVLRGTADPGSPLTMLRGNALVWTTVFRIVDRWTAWKRKMNRSAPAYLRHVATITFPPPTGIQVNMMPILPCDLPGSVPGFLRQYIAVIKDCIFRLDRHEFSWSRVPQPVWYLTVDESPVVPGTTHRRRGLHVERTGVDGRFVTLSDPSFGDTLLWGDGYATKGGKTLGGILMASSVGGSCRVHPVMVDDPHTVTDSHGGLDHVRDLVGDDGETLDAGEVCWFTDRTPHESLPLPIDDASVGYRQFFRLVIGRVGTWYSRTNTANPLGIVPGPDTVVSDVDRFDPGLRDLA